MSKSFDIGNSSDMKKFNEHLENSVKENAKKSLSSEMFDVECPHCGKEISIPAGLSKCPECGKEIDLNLNFDF